MPRDIALHVNGRDYVVRVDPDTPIIYVLRNDLGLKGAQFGCGLEQCGACKVLIDGVAEPSCKRPISSVERCDIVTLEGLGSAENLHPVQRAFLDEGALQCGFCTGGMIIAAKALLDSNPHPTDAEIRRALEVHICRCGTYDRVLKAIRRAAGEVTS